MSKVLAFMITRANTPERLATLKATIEQMRETAGHPCELTIHAMTKEANDYVIQNVRQEREILVYHGENLGQHIITNREIKGADELGADYLLRVDDDCKFLTKRWLAKMIEAAEKLGPEFIISPSVVGLINPPDMTEVVDKDGVPIRVLLSAIGGVCRLHNVDVLVDLDEPYVSDVRLPLGSGDATGIGKWALLAAEHKRPRWMVWLDQVRVKHNTTKQRQDDARYHEEHALFQTIPYIPAWRG